MVRVLVYLFIIALLAAGAAWLADQPGEVWFLWQGQPIVEAKVAIAAIVVILLAFLALVAWAVIRFVFGLPSAFGFASRARRRARGFEAISRGMVAIGAGDPIAAGRHAVDARKFAANEPLTLLLEAQSAQLSGDRGQAEAAFKAMLDKPETRVLGLRGLFVEARRRGDMAAARAFADDAVRRSPSLAWANDALLDFHTAAGDWQAARTAVERRAALRLADKGEAKRQRAVLLAAEALEAKDREPEKALAAALEAVKLAPGLTPAAALAGRMLSERGDIKKAARLLEAAWKQVSHPDIASAYLDVRLGDSARDRLSRAETLTKLRPADPEGVLALAGAAIHAQDFVRARATLKPLLAGGASVRACLLMAELEEAEHGATGRVREWLARATRAPRDAAWVADGLISDQWLPVSPISGRLDAFVWTVPPATLGSQGAHLDDDVLADIDEPSAPLIEGKAEIAEAVTVPPAAGLAPPAAPEPPKPEPKPEAKVETKPESAVTAAPPPAEPVVEIAPATTKPVPQQGKPAPVVFPVAHAPDDPGPEQQAPGEVKGRFRIFS
jgi:HemY protein